MRKPPATATPFTYRWRASPRLYRVDKEGGRHEGKLKYGFPFFIFCAIGNTGGTKNGNKDQRSDNEK